MKTYLKRNSLAALVVVAALLSTAERCPSNPTAPERVDQLVLLAKAADRAVQITNIVEAAQTTEIALFDSKTVPNFTLEKHQQYQRAFKKFADIAKPQLILARDASTAEAVRADAIRAVENGAQELIKEFNGSPSPVLAAIFTTLATTLAIVGV